MPTKSIPIKDICITGGTQHRPVDKKVVIQYAERKKAGDNFPLIEITFDGNNYYLTDGFHRVAAARKLGKNYINANVVNGTRRDAKYSSFQANKTNAFPRQPGTLKGIAEEMLKDEEWGKMSIKDMANHIGISERYVKKVHADLKKEANSSKSQGVNSSPPKPGSKPKKQLSRAKSRNVKRGDSDYEADVPEKVVLDATGKEVPKHLVKYFERANEFRAMIKQLNDMLKTVREGKNAGDLFYKFIKIENLTAEVNNVKRILRFAKPHAVCRYCGGDEKNDECRACGGCGFANEMAWKSTAKELK